MLAFAAVLAYAANLPSLIFTFHAKDDRVKLTRALMIAFILASFAVIKSMSDLKIEMLAVVIALFPRIEFAIIAWYLFQSNYLLGIFAVSSLFRSILESSQTSRPALLFEILNSEATFTPPSFGNAGADLFPIEPFTLKPNETKRVKTGVRFDIDTQYYVRIAERSGNACKGIHVGGGVIDSSFTGEIEVILYNLSEKEYKNDGKTAIAQAIIEPQCTWNMKETKKVTKLTARGSSGFGSSDTTFSEKVLNFVKFPLLKHTGQMKFQSRGIFKRTKTSTLLTSAQMPIAEVWYVEDTHNELWVAVVPLSLEVPASLDTIAIDSNQISTADPLPETAECFHIGFSFFLHSIGIPIDTRFIQLFNNSFSPNSFQGYEEVVIAPTQYLPNLLRIGRIGNDFVCWGDKKYVRNGLSNCALSQEIARCALASWPLDDLIHQAAQNFSPNAIEMIRTKFLSKIPSLADRQICLSKKNVKKSLTKNWMFTNNVYEVAGFVNTYGGSCIITAEDLEEPMIVGNIPGLNFEDDNKVSFFFVNEEDYSPIIDSILDDTQNFLTLV